MQTKEMVAANYISKNIEVFKSMVKIGAVPVSYLNYYRIYQFYISTHHMTSKMDRYNFTADTMKTNPRTVMTAIKEMEKKV